VAQLRIVLTGGPGGGKTTAAELFRRELGDQVVVVPESATTLFAGGFPRDGDADAQRSAQRAIFEVQRSLEDIQSAKYPDRTLLCDRGTIDGAAYWPDGAEDFFARMGTTHEAQLARYDTVLFFETAAAAGLRIEGGNPYRVESNVEAVAIDRRLQDLWRPHPGFRLVTHDQSFLKKIVRGLDVLQAVLDSRAPGGVSP
jgi:predicted ATPase